MLTAVTCGLLVALGRHGRAKQCPIIALPARVVQRGGRLIVLIAAAGAFAWALLTANNARLAEAHWKRAEATAYYLEAEQWRGSEQAQKYLFDHAQAATNDEPDNIQYHHWLGVYRWLSLTPYVDPNTNQLHPQARPWARQLVDDLYRARPLCPTFGVLCSLAGEIEMFTLADPNGAVHIRQGYRLAPCNGPVCLIAARADAAEGAAEQACEKLTRAVRLDGTTFGQAASLCIDDLVRPDLALKLAGQDAGRLSHVAGLLAASDQHTELAEQVRAKVYELLARRTQEPDAPAATHIAMARRAEREGDSDSALEHYRLALRKDYDQVGWHYELACLLARVGRVEDAIHEARICLRLRQDYAPARRLLEELVVRPPDPSVAAGQ
jgi:tetratricopeptide (TPR) repeat protein